MGGVDWRTEAVLEGAGLTFEEGKKHTMVRLGARSAMMPRHPSKEVASGTLHAILRHSD